MFRDATTPKSTQSRIEDATTSTFGWARSQNRLRLTERHAPKRWRHRTSTRSPRSRRMNSLKHINYPFRCIYIYIYTICYQCIYIYTNHRPVVLDHGARQISEGSVRRLSTSARTRRTKGRVHALPIKQCWREVLSIQVRVSSSWKLNIALTYGAEKATRVVHDLPAPSTTCRNEQSCLLDSSIRCG